MPFDPISLGLGGTQALGGVLQSIFSGKNKAERDLENYANSYKKNESIMDYYTKALNRYNQNPYNSASYTSAMKTANRGLSTGINTLQDRRSVLAGLPGLVAGYNDAGLKATANAEREQGAALNTLGTATQMKAREDKYPFELKYNLLAAKAAGANAQKAAGWQNIFGGLGTAALGLGKKRTNTANNYSTNTYDDSLPQ